MVKELYSLQDRVLARISKFADKHKFPFVLTGGTVLVRFNLKKEYRISYDLDFFATAPVKFWPMRELTFYLIETFGMVQTFNASSPSLNMYRIFISDGKAKIMLDFVEDQFSGAFKTVPVPDFKNLQMETADEGIYFRKVYAVFGNAHKPKVAERIKDIVDLIELNRIKPFSAFLKYDFPLILRENGVIVDEKKLLERLNKLPKLLMENKEIAEDMLRDIQSIYTFEEVLEWIELQLRNLKKGFRLNL